MKFGFKDGEFINIIWVKSSKIYDLPLHCLRSTWCGGAKANVVQLCWLVGWGCTSFAFAEGIAKRLCRIFLVCSFLVCQFNGCSVFLA